MIPLALRGQDDPVKLEAFLQALTMLSTEGEVTGYNGLLKAELRWLQVTGNEVARLCNL